MTAVNVDRPPTRRRTPEPSPFLRDDVVRHVVEHAAVWTEELAIVDAWDAREKAGTRPWTTPEERERIDALQKRRAAIEASLAWFVIHEAQKAGAS